MAWAKEVCRDIRYQRKVGRVFGGVDGREASSRLLIIGWTSSPLQVQSIGVCRFLVNNWALLNVAVLLLTFVLNLVVLFGWVAPEKYNADYSYSVSKGKFLADISTAVHVMLRVFGAFHVVLCFMLLASFLLANRPTIPDWISSLCRLLRPASVLPSKE